MQWAFSWKSPFFFNKYIFEMKSSLKEDTGKPEISTATIEAACTIQQAKTKAFKLNEVNSTPWKFLSE